jgi:hypothetical protein
MKTTIISISGLLCAGLAIPGSVEAQVPTIILAPDLPDTKDVCPPMTRPDREFNGNGPIVQLEAEALVTPDAKEIRLRSFFSARELGGDISTAAHETNTFFHRVAGSRTCAVISAIVTPSLSMRVYTDTNHRIDERLPSTVAPSGEFVSLFKIRGDTSGLDIGNCTNDDTKYWHEYKELEYELDWDTTIPECAKEDGSDPETNIFDGDPILAALNEFADRVEMRIDNVEVQNNSDHVEEQSSFIRFELPEGGFLQTNFDVDPIEEGRYTIFIDDVNSNNVEIVPDGGGYILEIGFEADGLELRSNCEGKFLESVGAWVACELGNELRVDLGVLEARVRVFLEVDESGDSIQIRPVSTVEAERDIFISVKVLSQQGPCEDNALAFSHDCMEIDELELAIQASIADSLSALISDASQNQGSNFLGRAVSAILSVVTGMPSQLLAIIVADGEGDGFDAGDLIFVSR